ncbi:MAG TPA: hypothetical protein VFO77_02800, partial [Actinoplanes sp.]|nr:hypothetical protein [Actinoplanes sp.]
MTTPQKRGWLRAGRPAAGDAGSITMALLFTLVGLSVTAIIGPTVVTQIKNSGIAAGRVRALHAAQTGLTVAVGQIRAAKDPQTSLGDLDALPCGPLSGPVGGGSGATYTVTIAYLSEDPNGAWTVSDPLPCGSLTEPPAYAALSATGVDGAVTRRLRTTYRFRSSWANIPGGRIRQFTDQSLCLDAGSASPAAGAAVRLQQCQPGASAQQTFGYYPDLSI